MLYISFNFCLNYSKESFGESDSDFKPVSLYTKRLHLKPLRLRYRTTKLASEKRRKNLTPRCFVESNIFFQQPHSSEVKIFFSNLVEISQTVICFFWKPKNRTKQKRHNFINVCQREKVKKFPCVVLTAWRVSYETFLILAFIMGSSVSRCFFDCVNQRIYSYISDRRNSTALRLPNIWLSQLLPLPALSDGR